MPKPVFISYSTDDTATTEAIRDGLESGGIPCWMAPRDIVPGKEYAEQIIDAIEACTVLLLVLSETSNHSQYVVKEVERAIAKRKVVIPFRIHNITPSRSLEFFISNTQWVEARPGALAATMGTLVLAINSHLGAQDAVGRTLPAAAQPEQAAPLVRATPNSAPGAPAAHPAPWSRDLPPLVGRSAEWQTLQDIWAAARQGRAQLVVLIGEAGIGKTRLAEELLTVAGQQGALTAQARTYAAAGRLAYAPPIDWLRTPALHQRLAQLNDADLSELARLMPETLNMRTVLTLPNPAPESLQRTRLFEALTRALLVDRQPLLLLLDDLQWSDQETLDWLHFLLRHDPSAPLLVVATLRAGDAAVDALRPWWMALVRDEQASVIELGALDASATLALAQQLSSDALSAEHAARLYGQTEGNPLFVVELVRMELQTGGMGSTGAPPAVAPQSTAVLPTRMQAVLQMRLAQLSPTAHAVAHLAATVGRAFSVSVLIQASDEDEHTVLAALDELWQRRIIREQEVNSYDFSHDKLREVAYRELSPIQRRTLHGRVARALEAVHAGSLELVSGQLAVHYEQAGVAERAIAYCELAAQAAQQVYAAYETIHYLQRGLALIAQRPHSTPKIEQELAFRLALGSSLVATYGYGFAQVREVYERVQALTRELGKPPNPAVLRALALYFIVRRQYERTYELGEQILRLAQQAPERVAPILFVEGHYVLGVTEFWRGEFAPSRANLEAVIAAYDVQQYKTHTTLYAQDPGVICRVRLAWTLWYLGYPEQARQRAEEARQLAQAIGHPYTTGYALTYSAWLACDQRDWSAVAELVTELETYARKYVLAYWLSIVLVFKGRLQIEQGEFEQGIASILEGMAAQQAADVEVCVPCALSALAVGFGRSTLVGVDWRPAVRQTLSHFPAIGGAVGNGAMGVAALDEALATVAERGDRYYEAELHRLKGELLQARGEPAEVVAASFQRSLSLARQQQARSIELRAAISLSRLWAKQGNVVEARQLLAAIYGWFTEGFNTADLQEARALLDELESKS